MSEELKPCVYCGCTGLGGNVYKGDEKDGKGI